MLIFWKSKYSEFKCVVAFILIFLCDSITSVISKDVNNSHSCLTDSSDYVCLTPACIHSASTIINNINEDIDPCEDFYSFVCGNFVKNTVIPQNSPSESYFTITQEKVLQQIRRVLDEPSGADELNTFRLLKKYYSLCMDTGFIDKNSVSVVKNILQSLGGWPVLQNSEWNEDVFDWKKLMYQFRKIGIPTNSILNIYSGANTYNSSKNIINCDEPTLGLDRNHLVNGFDNKFVQSYFSYKVDLAIMFGADKSTALHDIEESVKFEISLAKITLAIEDRRNMSALTNMMTVAELQNQFPVLPWVEYLQNLINDPNITITENEEVDVGVPQFLTKLDKLLRNTSKRTLANYIMSQCVIHTVPLLTTDLRTRRMKYMKHFQGTAEMNPRWKECSIQASKSLTIAVDSLYVRNYFDDETKNHAKVLVDHLRAQFLHMLKNVRWMDNTTRNRAINKALKMEAHIGYPIEFLNDTKIEEFYRELIPDNENYLIFSLNIFKFLTDRSFRELRKFVDKSEWTKQSTITTVNAYYNFGRNGIELPASILQGIFFDRNRPNYLNFGSIGFAIGHEITHGFDDMGRQYDENGNLVDWWEQLTAHEFLKNAQCIIDQFNNYTSPQVNMQINGINSQGENIADNGGVNEAYLAYKTWVKHHGVEPKLPGIKYNQEQLFWISLATTWCIKERDEYLRQEILTDNHPPSDVRVLGLISNSEYFSKDFNCKINAKMNPSHKCSVW